MVTQAATAARHSQRAGNKIYQDWKGPGGIRARDLSNMGPWSWRMMSFRVDFGARCAFSGSFLVCGAPFLGSILVRGVWCADFGVDFGARCVVRRFWARFWCAVCGAPILGPIGARCAPFLGSILVRGVWCANFGVDFGARCAVFGFDFGNAVCGAPILGSILVHGALFGVRFWCAVCGAPIVVLIFGFDFGACRAHGKM